jgi:hypothetical protein
MKIIEVIPAPGGWMLRSDAIENTLFFRCAQSAESAAVRLAQGLADAGQTTHVGIHPRGAFAVRRFVVAALRTQTQLSKGTVQSL